ncbi:MAG: aspartate-semialdehyde dehydrogenase [Candidatus Ranarchaeia archaeon]
MKKIGVAILGATGAVGQRFISLLENHPTFSVTTLMASERSRGKSYGDAVSWILDTPIPADISDLEVKPLSTKSTEGSDEEIVFSAIPASIAGPIEMEFAERGYFVASNASSNRMVKDVPILIPDVNPSHIELIKMQRENRKWTTGALTTNSNCSTAGLVMSLKPLEVKYGIEQVHVTTMQALSGAGYPGVASMDIIDNVIPHIKGEEAKLEQEPNKILGQVTTTGISHASIPITATCTRVNTIDGHLEVVNIKLKENPDRQEFINTLQQYTSDPQSLNLPSAPQPPIIVMDREDRPQPRKDRMNGHPETAKGMACTIGKIKETSNGFRYLLLTHNTIRGAAGTNILAAEYAIKKKLI